jgi:hypothetical protein
MKLFPQDSDIILYETAFENDLLDREPISKQLSELVNRIDDPIVLALDDKWGTGKTYFLKRWVAAHKSESGGPAVTVYFDAFENDHLSDPLISIITALSDRIPAEQQSTLNKWKSVAAKLAKPAFGIALSLATLGAKQYLDEIGDTVTEALNSEAKDAAQSLWDAEKQRKDAVKRFKELLVELTEGEAAPIVIVVDELDRCRPDYALSVLEVIKHFFAVPKVHFILGVNGVALENSVKARYGANMDAESYLRKFINVSFSLPRTIGHRGDETVLARYASHLSAEMALPKNISDECIKLILFVATQNDVSLRDVGKVFSKIALLPKAASTLNESRLKVLCALLVSSVVVPKLHNKFVSASASTDEIRGFLGASKILTSINIDNSSNPNHDRNLTIWFVIILTVCGLDSVDTEENLPEWVNRVEQSFGENGFRTHVKELSAEIQREWVDVFRI